MPTWFLCFQQTASKRYASVTSDPTLLDDIVIAMEFQHHATDWTWFDTERLHNLVIEDAERNPDKCTVTDWEKGHCEIVDGVIKRIKPTFFGKRDLSGICHLYLKDGDTLTEISPDRSLAVIDHSPTGFEWGYGGSGPSQLALAILIEATDSEETALQYYHDFKFEVIANAPDDSWTITGEWIQKWLDKKQLSEQVSARNAYPFID